jgi:hypothetical protein
VVRPEDSEACILLRPGGPVEAGARVYDLRGHLIATIAEPQDLAAGVERIWRWDLKDAEGAEVPSGTYFCVVTMGGESLEHRVAVVR